MAKGVVLTKDVKQRIAALYLKHPKRKTREIYQEIFRWVQQNIQWADPDWPGLSVVQKELAKIRKRDAERSPESQELITTGDCVLAFMVRVFY